MSDYRWVEKGWQYAASVLEGGKPANLYERLACERFFRDYERSTRGALDPEFPYRLDFDEAERWLKFLNRLRHVKGPKAGQRFEPSAWQCFIVLNLYGWLDADGCRRFTESYIEVPRGNGKSFLAAALGVGHLLIDGDVGGEVYCGATTEKQAWEVFRPARGMCLNNPELCAEYGIEVHPRSRALYVLESGNRFEPVVGDPGDGAAPSFAVIDELHEHKNTDLIDTMTTGLGKRAEPLLFVITTAGTDLGGPCRERRQDLVKILDGSVVDESIFGIIYTIDEPDPHGKGGDAWDSEEALEKANPNWHENINKRFVLSELRKAKRSPSKQNTFRTKHLNQWVGAKTAWLNMLKLQRCAKSRIPFKLDPAEARNYRWFIGLDLASRVDLAAMALLGVQGRAGSKDARYRAHWQRWVPEEQLKDGKLADRYAAWHKAGVLNVTDGDVVDYDLIEAAISALQGQIEIVEIGYDPFQATQLATHLAEEGFPMIEVGQTVRNLSEPMKELESAIYNRQLEFSSHDVAAVWEFGNVVAKKDLKDNIFPNKERDAQKIDDVVALIIAMNRAIAPREGDRIYDGTELFAV